MTMSRGKLRIYFGYAAGVGKTYTMLRAAQEAKKEGKDVVIGYIEPHDRPETMKMAEGLEVLPLKTIKYKNITLHEFDVDAALKRRPDILLVDELAHTNAEGSKNQKRWIDVQELVNNGLEVWTTINVQHIEGLHDLVDGATNVNVNERVPDDIFDYADEVVLVDIEPSALIERMKEGKIYKKSRAAVALENFFKTDQLSSLREMYLRRNADRIEKLSDRSLRRTKILVLISPSPSSERNIRIAARMASAYHCKFSALYVETHGDLNDSAAHYLKNHMKVVKDLGGELVVKYGDDIVETVADYVRVAGITDLVLGKTWQSAGRKGGLEEKFIARMPNLQLLIVPDGNHTGYKSNGILKFLSDVFQPKKLLRKYRTANRTLDLHNVIETELLESTQPEQTIADILSRSFLRSCAVYGERSAVSIYNKEDCSFWDTPHEQGVIEWVKMNNLPAGKGTDTLRDARAIYLPIKTRKGIAVVAFSCLTSKLTVTDRLVFSQIKSLLGLVL